ISSAYLFLGYLFLDAMAPPIGSEYLLSVSVLYFSILFSSVYLHISYLICDLTMLIVSSDFAYPDLYSCSVFRNMLQDVYRCILCVSYCICLSQDICITGIL